MATHAIEEAGRPRQRSAVVPGAVREARLAFDADHETYPPGA
jgi:hypothetical protein